MKIDRDTEMMICAKEQGYSFDSPRFGGCIGFPIEVMIIIWGILKEEKR